MSKHTHAKTSSKDDGQSSPGLKESVIRCIRISKADREEIRQSWRAIQNKRAVVLQMYTDTFRQAEELRKPFEIQEDTDEAEIELQPFFQNHLYNFQKFIAKSTDYLVNDEKKLVETVRKVAKKHSSIQNVPFKLVYFQTLAECFVKAMMEEVKKSPQMQGKDMTHLEQLWLLFLNAVAMEIRSYLYKEELKKAQRMVSVSFEEKQKDDFYMSPRDSPNTGPPARRIGYTGHRSA